MPHKSQPSRAQKASMGKVLHSHHTIQDEWIKSNLLSVTGISKSSLHRNAGICDKDRKKARCDLMTINEIILELKKNWHIYQPEIKINILQKAFIKVFPSSYLLFLKELGEGSYQFNEFILSSWCAETIIESNKRYMINDYLGDDFIGIATDGGGICFLLDFREVGEPKLACVGLGDLDIDEVIVLADSFTKGLQFMLEQKITLDTLLG